MVKKAEKNNVRECDEIEKGHFQAYVDENNNSFDVSITVNNKEAIIDHSCDCNSKSDFCRHKTALLLYITNPKKDSGQIKNSKKVSQLELLVDEADPERLKAWIKDLLAKNKDLELAFMHQFSNQQKNYTPADIKQLTLDAVKTVVKSRKKVEVSEMKKIVGLWTEIHNLFITQYTAHVTDENAFQNFNALIEACEETQLKVNTSSNGFSKYLEGLLIKAMEPLHNLQNEDAWDLATGYFADRIHGETSSLKINYLAFLSNLLDTSSMDRKKRLADRMVKQYAKRKPQKFYKDDEMYTDTVLNIVKNGGLFAKYYDTFKPLRFRNDYNEKLISLLIQYGHLKLAEKYCQEHINEYNRQQKSILYLQLLKEIYTIEKDSGKLSEVLKELIPQTFDFDDFLFIYAQIESEDEKKKWRYKMLSRARHTASSDFDAMAFSFKLMDYEKKYKRMLEYIDVSSPYSIIIKYADKMAIADKKGFLKEVLHKSDDYYGLRIETTVEDENMLFSELLSILQKHYSKTEIQMAIINAENTKWIYRQNRFITFIKKNIH